MAGTLYAIVDKNFTVQAAYWSDADDLTTASDADLKFEKDNILATGFYCCAYPIHLSMASHTFFEYQ